LTKGDCDEKLLRLTTKLRKKRNQIEARKEQSRLGRTMRIDGELEWKDGIKGSR